MNFLLWFFLYDPSSNKLQITSKESGAEDKQKKSKRGNKESPKKKNSFLYWKTNLTFFFLIRELNQELYYLLD